MLLGPKLSPQLEHTVYVPERNLPDLRLSTIAVTLSA